MGKQAMDTGFLDRAMIYAIEAHKNIERRGKGFPYVIHPMEAVTIVASMTNDQELLAAAALHDVVEDTDITVEDIRREFGDRVADLVHTESDIVVEGMDSSQSWHIRKQAAMDTLRAASRDAKIVAMGDKLSNLRAIYRDYMKMGDDLWKIFHVKDRSEHEWHYRGLMESLADLSDTVAYREFKHILNDIFSEEARETLVFDRELALKMFDEEGVNKSEVTRLDFTYVKWVNFSGLRELMRAQKEGYKFRIVNVGETALNMFFYVGADRDFEIIKKPGMINIDQYEEFGRGTNTTGFNAVGGGAMLKLYDPDIDPQIVEKEKIMSMAVYRLGIPTPMGGGMVRHINSYGMIFERIVDKKSISRVLTDNPEQAGKMGELFANMCLELHSKRCDLDVFPSMAGIYKKAVMDTDALDDRSKLKVMSFIDNTLETYTCLHGDIHTGNIIMTEMDNFFIDLSDFAYGNPKFDLGCIYYNVFMKPDEDFKRDFHCTRNAMEQMWASFVRVYFPELELEEANKRLRPYAGLKALHYSVKYGMNDHYRQVIRDTLTNI